MKIGIVGYGNLGKGVETAVSKNPDTQLAAIFTRRHTGTVTSKSGVPVLHVDEAANYRGKIDVMVLCGGSATDLPLQGPEFAKLFSTVDSFDTHAKIPEYFKKIDETARESGTLALISCGWDPGVFSLARALFSAVIPDGVDYTFWGKGVSQGHSDAIRRVDGVIDARQYTIPVEEALTAARGNQRPEFSTRQKHLRDCYVVAAMDANKEKIKEEIINMPNYFSDYDTTVTFISEEEMKEKHSALPHGGFVIRNGETDDGVTQVAELSLKLESNPQFTASVLLAYARAVYKMSSEGKTGAITVLDVPFGLLSHKSPEQLRKELL